MVAALALKARRNWQPFHDCLALGNTKITADVEVDMRAALEVNGTTVARMSPAERTKELILIADDNETTLEAFSDYLLTSGFRVITARNGKEAISTAVDTKASCHSDGYQHARNGWD